MRVHAGGRAAMGRSRSSRNLTRLWWATAGMVVAKVRVVRVSSAAMEAVSMTRLRGVLLALPLAVLFAGCPIYVDDDHHGGGPRCVGPGCACDTDRDCEAGTFCG